MREPSIGIVSIGDLPARRIVDLARLAEHHGLSSIWHADEPFYRGAFVMAAACAVATEHLRIGLGVVSPYDHPPAWMAKDYATLQDLADGRVILGVGASWRPPIEAQGIQWTRPLSAVGETMEIVRRLMAGEDVVHEGRQFRLDGVKLSFAPPPHRPHIFAGSMFERSLAQAGRSADGVILSIFCPVPYVRAAVRLIDEARQEVGREDPFEIVQYIPMEVSGDHRAARASLKRYAAFFVQHSFGSDPDHWTKVAELGRFDLDEFIAINDAVSSGVDPETAVSDRFLDTFAIAGTVDHCIELLADYKAAGTTEVAALFAPWSDIETQIELIGSCIAPRWNDL